MMRAPSGFLNVNKPLGCTSMDVVRLAKRLTRQRRVGHGGTLDPHASGVLPLCFGRATRTMEFLINSSKIYRFWVTLGITTDTYDQQGKIMEERDIGGITRDVVEGALESFRGIVNQVPPMYSALKQGGQRLYALARRGEVVTRLPRRVQMFRLEMLKWDPPYLSIEAECGRGVYIRSLAHDLGQVLGCGAYLSALARLKTGPFFLEESLSLDELEVALRRDTWPSLLYPSDAPLLHLPAAVVGPLVESSVRSGRTFVLPTPRKIPVHQEACRLYNLDGNLIALARFQSPPNLWGPDVVFPEV